MRFLISLQARSLRWWQNWFFPWIVRENLSHVSQLLVVYWQSQTSIILISAFVFFFFYYARSCGMQDLSFLILYLWLCWVLIAPWNSHCGGFSCCKAQALGCVGFSSCGLQGSGAQAQQLWCKGLVALWHGGIFPDQGSNLHLLHWQVGSLPLNHQESPQYLFFQLQYANSQLQHVGFNSLTRD